MNIGRGDFPKTAQSITDASTGSQVYKDYLTGYRSKVVGD
jgi:hypothetical protein